MVNFKEIISRMKEITGLTQRELSSKIFNTSDSNLSNKIRRNKVDLDSVMAWAVNTNVNLNWLFTGKGEIYLIEDADRTRGFEGKDIDTLKLVLEAVEERLAKNKIKLAPGKKAEVIALLYELFTETEKEVDVDTVERYLRLVA
ncbi:MAG: helix-turn-helix domain-containing protein [Deltaproteobacteria bacterium]|nr:helix-turn-helix domain-containing protein [Deltaproteobacteria bacterium]